MQVPLHFIGVDVSKAELVIATHGHDSCLSVLNECTAIAQWLRTLPPGSLLAMESTGRYHQLLAHLAAGMGLPVFVLNARDVYFYAKGLGARGKTDRVDARVIARYLAEHHERLHALHVPDACQAEVAQLLRQRWTVVTKRTALHESLKACSPSIAHASGELDAAFAALLRTIDARITALIDADAPLHRARTLLQASSAWALNPAPCSPACSRACPLPALMPWWPTAAWIPGPTTRGAAGGVVDSPSAATLHCAIRCSWPPCRPVTPAPFLPLTRHCVPEVSRPPRPW